VKGKKLFNRNFLQSIKAEQELLCFAPVKDMHDQKRVGYERLLNFTKAVLHKRSLSEEAASALAEVLIAADMRGVPSHGLAHLPRYLADIEKGLTQKDAPVETEREFGAIALLNANHTLGAFASKVAMSKAIAMADTHGIGAVAVHNSCHHGISGYYAMMALEHDMIGLAMTNTAALVVPTSGLEARLGTNPIAFAAPAGSEAPFALDMSTSVVTRGTIEICARLNEPIPEGWAVDHNGESPRQAFQFLDDLLSFKGGILPLGGRGVLHGGHKGYGLAVMVDILCSLLSGGAFGTQVRDTKETAACVNHFFMAVKIDAFRKSADFKNDMDVMLKTLRETKPEAGVEKVVYAGIEAHALEMKALNEGVPLLTGVFNELNKLARTAGVDELRCDGPTTDKN
jgi:L-2-hydroxycarboxylate dehydrogenase (NAD+)